MSLTLPRSAAGLALLAVMAAGCGTVAAAYHTGPKPAAAHAQHGPTMMHTAATPGAMAHHRHHATTQARPANPIPQGNGGDHDADNNGGPSDGDGNL